MSGDIPLKVLKSSGFPLRYLAECTDEVLRNSKCSESLKLFDAVPVYKEQEPTDKSNFRPISICFFFQRYLKKLYLINYATI